MKLFKILAVVLSVCLLASAFVACDSGNGGDETTASETNANTNIEVTLIIKDGSTEVAKETVTCNGILGHAIEVFCAGEYEEEFEIFDASTGLLITIGDLTAGGGKSWKAYYEDEGQQKAFDSIKDKELEAGKTVVIVLE